MSTSNAMEVSADTTEQVQEAGQIDQTAEPGSAERDAEMAEAAEAATRTAKAKAAYKELNVVELRGKMTFEKALKAWISATTLGKRYAQFIAEMAMEHFYQHGDTAKMAAFIDALERHGKDYVRVQAFKAWVRQFAPVTQSEGKLVKDKNPKRLAQFLKNPDEPESADNPLVMPAAAFSQPFWTFNPDREADPFTAMEIDKALWSTIKRIEKRGVDSPSAAAHLQVVKTSLKAIIAATDAAQEAKAA